MTVVSSSKYQIVADLPSRLPNEVFSNTETLIGLTNIDSGYDFIRRSIEAGQTKFFYIGDAGIPDYLSVFKRTLDEDLRELSQ
jgi:hypothetical protein